MMCDTWGFGLLLENGNVLGIEQIEKIVQAADGSLWLDVKLLDYNWHIDDEYLEDFFSGKIIKAPMPDRCYATINASKIVVALEICTS